MNKPEKILAVTFIGLLIIGAGLFGYYKNKPSDKSLGSVVQGGECQATTTPISVSQQYIQVLNGPGTLCSVIRTFAGGGGAANFYVYDATSTDTALINPVGTTTLAYMVSTGAVATLVFDTPLKYGLLLEWTTGSRSTTTVTFRQSY